ncbi:hypothetical protein AKJ16_DCAP13291 [Drosera capensis]
MDYPFKQCLAIEPKNNIGRIQKEACGIGLLKFAVLKTSDSCQDMNMLAPWRLRWSNTLMVAPWYQVPFWDDCAVSSYKPLLAYDCESIFQMSNSGLIPVDLNPGSISMNSSSSY